MFFFFFKNESDFYSFVSSSLVSEADKEVRKIFLNYSIERGVKIDAFLPNGLSILGKNHKLPFYVEIKKSMTIDDINNSNIRFRQSGFDGTVFYITQNTNIEITNLIYDQFETMILGLDFINLLKERNPEAYLNYVLGDKNNTFIEKKDSHKKKEKTLNSIKVLLSNNEELSISDDDPEKLCAMYEREFKAYLNVNELKSNCALFIGNGVSIPFGSDNWSTMIRNLVDRLEPH